MRNPRPGFFKRLVASKYFMRIIVPVVVLLIGALLLIIAPWQSTIPEIATPEPEIEATPEPPPPPTIEEIPCNHEWIEATYEEPKTCAICGETEGEPIPPTPEPVPGIYHPLTGAPMAEDVSKIRPWAMALGNTAEALPLHGIGSAEILVEYPVEGTTRFMAIYQDISDIEKIGGFRSLRSSSMQIAQGFDAIFGHWIGRTYEDVESIGNPITRLQYPTVDVSSLGYRDYTVGKGGAPHNAYARPEKLLSGLPSTFRTEHEEGFKQVFEFVPLVEGDSSKDGDGTPKDGEDAKVVVVNFIKGFKTTRFGYDEGDKLYYVRHHGLPLTDGLDGKQLSFTNIIIIRTEMRTGIGAAKHTYIGTIGDGSGYFICGGKAIEIKWSRPGLDDSYSFTLQDGTPLKLGVGRTFVCFTSRAEDQKPEFE